jgi:hypothetical protein
MTKAEIYKEFQKRGMAKQASLDITEAARQLNIDVLTLDRWIEEYGLK